MNPNLTTMEHEAAVRLLKTEIDKKYYELGRKIYEMVEQDIHEINLMVEKIIQIKIDQAQKAKADTLPQKSDKASGSSTA